MKLVVFACLFLAVSAMDSLTTNMSPEDITKTFTLTVQEITDALTNPQTDHPLEKLIIGKILAVFKQENITINNGAISYNQPDGGTQVVQDECKVHVEISQGWKLQATLKPDTAVSLELGVGGNIHQPELIVGAGVHLDSKFKFEGNIHLAEGTTAIPGKKCAIIATENSKEWIEGELDIAVNVTLRLGLQLVKDAAGHHHIQLTPVVHVAGELISFKALVLSHLSVFGIPLTKISLLVDIAVNVALKLEVNNKLLQKELAILQTFLQAEANKIWPPASSGELPGITPDLLAHVQTALDNINGAQNAHYP